MDRHLIFYYIGIAIVFFTHIQILMSNLFSTHALLNLFAASCIAYYFMHKEGFIRV
jgi:hypothetical protein